MRTNQKITKAKTAKKDEFYTQYEDIEREIEGYFTYDSDVFKDKTILLPCDDYEQSNFTKYFVDNFERFNIKKIISTCYTDYSPRQINLFETAENNLTNKSSYGKIYIQTEDGVKKGVLKGNGDFRSKEITNYRDEADIIITNPPFSLCRTFFKWLIDGNKKFIIIANQNIITNKYIFPYIRDNQIWLGGSFNRNQAYFSTPYEDDTIENTPHRDGMILVTAIMWFTNIEHNHIQKPLNLMTLNENLTNSKHKDITEHGYLKYDNFDAIDVPYTDAIPSDYKGIMGVPITFLQKWDRSKYKIIGVANHGTDGDFDLFKPIINGKEIYKRLLIQRICT